jgi:hypothetical protein
MRPKNMEVTGAQGRENYRVFGTCEIEIANPCSLIIFGGHGDLSKRKLVPSLYRLFKNNILSEQCYIYPEYGSH